ncbi:MAG TPA: hypothetical protein VIK20_01325 [Bacteroidales bacterium]
MQANSPVNMRRFNKWLSEFSTYRHQITEGRIERWIKQFAQNDKDLAARLLDSVDFINHQQISTAFRDLLLGLDGWSPNEKNRHGIWRFVSYSVSAGESGDEMLHKFRTANNLASRKFNNLFIYKSELLKEKLNADDTVVFIDDFSGTGNQACDFWADIKELLPGEPRIFLILVAASEKALTRIQENTEINCIPHKLLKEKDCIFSDKCTYFNLDEKNIIYKYCKKVDKIKPKGYGDCGFLLVFSHTCPNDSIPILHKTCKNWEGLFRRYD